MTNDVLLVSEWKQNSTVCVCVREREKRECTQMRNKAMSQQHTHLAIINQAKQKDENREGQRETRGQRVCREGTSEKHRGLGEREDGKEKAEKKSVWA